MFVLFQPLMVRFQTAYKNHLLKQKEKLELEEREVVGFFSNKLQYICSLADFLSEIQCVPGPSKAAPSMKAPPSPPPEKGQKSTLPTKQESTLPPQPEQTPSPPGDPLPLRRPLLLRRPYPIT